VRTAQAVEALGLRGRKKLQDLFVDARSIVPSDAIPSTPPAIVGVVGHAVAEDFRVTDRTRAVVTETGPVDLRG
jgi:hypothetical protein